MQGSKTDFYRTFLNNPTEFIRAGFSGTQAEKKNLPEHRAEQFYRLQETKAQVARTILHSHKDVGDNNTFYESAKLSDLQEINSRFFKNLYDIRYNKDILKRIQGIKIVADAFEFGLLYVFGFLNCWGASVIRPTVIIFISFLFFAGLYSIYPINPTISNPFQKSFDITMLAGYTNQSRVDQPKGLRVLQAIHLIVSVMLYSIFFSTIFLRNSRARV